MSAEPSRQDAIAEAARSYWLEDVRHHAAQARIAGQEAIRAGVTVDQVLDTTLAGLGMSRTVIPAMVRPALLTRLALALDGG